MICSRYFTLKQKQFNCVEVEVKRVPVTSLIVTGSDNTMIRGDLIYHILETAKVKENKPADLKACTYD